MSDISLSFSVKHNFTQAAERIDEYPDKLDRALQVATPKAANTVEEAYKQTIPRKTGRTAATIGSVIEPKPDGATAYIGTSDEIAQYLEYGTRPHRIVPRNAKALRFEIGSRIVFAKSVNHPGTSAHNSLLKASQASQSLVERAYTDEVGEVFR